VQLSVEHDEPEEEEEQEDEEDVMIHDLGPLAGDVDDESEASQHKEQRRALVSLWLILSSDRQ
jgi:hypothetical protein